MKSTPRRTTAKKASRVKPRSSTKIPGTSPTTTEGNARPSPWPYFHPVFSTERVGKTCLAKHDWYAVLDCWLDAHPHVASAIQWNLPAAQCDWKHWPTWMRDELHQHFGEMLEWYANGMSTPYPSPFAMPLLTGRAQEPNVWGPRMMDYMARTVYFSYVGNTLAAELHGAFGWSITTYSDQQLYWLMTWNDLIQYRSASISKYPGYYLMTEISPATPAFVVNFLKSQSLLGPTALDTVARLVQWERCLSHYFKTEEEDSLKYTNFWGPYSPPIPASYMIDGSTYTGPDNYYQGRVEHWTAGCGGTSEFMKSVLRAVNIPVQAGMCGKSPHRAPYFPTLNYGLSHGDDPYDETGVVSPFPGWPVPTPLEYLTTNTDWNNWFGPGLDAATCDRNVGRRIADLAIQYQSDLLMDAYCKDVASQATHANGQVFDALKTNYTVAQLEAMHLWDKLDAKVKATGFCGSPASP